MSHKSLAATAVIPDLPAGAHSLILRGMNSGTTTDGADRFQVRLLEFNSAAVAAISVPIANAAGPLPVVGNFTTSGGPVLMFAHGSAAPVAANSRLGFDVAVDGNIRTTAVVGGNEAMSHRTLATAVGLTNLPAGSHSVLLSAMNGNTVADTDNTFQLRVIEFRESSIRVLPNPIEAVPGPLPVTGTLASSGGPVLLIGFGSAIAQAANSLVGMDFVVDGTIRTTGVSASTEALGRRLIGSSIVLSPLAAGSHSIVLRSMNSSSTSDAVDNYQLRAFEF